MPYVTCCSVERERERWLISLQPCLLHNQPAALYVVVDTHKELALSGLSWSNFSCLLQLLCLYTLGSMCRNPRRTLSLRMITPHQTEIIKWHQRSLTFSSAGRPNRRIGCRGAAELGDRLGRWRQWNRGKDSFSFPSKARSPLLMFLSCPLQEMQQPFAKEPYGIDLGALPADKDLLIYERWSHWNSRWDP